MIFVLIMHVATWHSDITFQMFLPDHHQGVGGEYRKDKEYLRLVARRIAEAQRVCFDAGLNMYVETHIQRVSEDPGAFVEIMVRSHWGQRCCTTVSNANSTLYILVSAELRPVSRPSSIDKTDLLAQEIAQREHGCYFELNGDLSHYLYRGFANDKGFMPAIMARYYPLHIDCTHLLIFNLVASWWNHSRRLVAVVGV